MTQIFETGSYVYLSRDVGEGPCEDHPGILFGRKGERVKILDYYKNLKNICGIASVENIASNKVLIKSGLVYVNKFIDPINGKFDNWYEFNL